ncbi:glutamic acid-rich protein-like [Venturia canescens]|uniref:glutamic acid-rich protein-like n=1 Tax=Venturia canescens TaxID=32260 RepID=UPI001C9D351D|nr:glutamic acid-rich protein-like [Venturia canescens]
MDASTQTIDPYAKVHFCMQTGEIGVWEIPERLGLIKEVERSLNRHNASKEGRIAKQSSGTQTARPKNKATQAFMWHLMPIDIDECRKPNRERLEQFVRRFTLEQIPKEFIVPKILSPIRDPANEANFKMPLSTEEWRRKRREHERLERKNYREEVARNGKEWTAWRIGEFNWEEEKKENDNQQESERKLRKRKKEDDVENNRKKKSIEKKQKDESIEKKKREQNNEREKENDETKKEKELVLIPLHLGGHWCLVTVDFESNSINYFDSLQGKNREYPTMIFEYLMMEAANKKQTSFDAKKLFIELTNGRHDQRVSLKTDRMYAVINGDRACRGRLTNVEDEEATLMLIDRGMTLMHPVDELHNLPYQFASVPPFCTKAYITNIKPYIGDRWDMVCSLHYQRKLVNQRAKVNILRDHPTLDGHEVDLFITPHYVNLRESLIQRGYATEGEYAFSLRDDIKCATPEEIQRLVNGEQRQEPFDPIEAELRQLEHLQFMDLEEEQEREVDFWSD